MKKTILFLFVVMSIYSCLAQQVKNFECIITQNKPMWIEAWVHNPLLELKFDGCHSYNNSYAYNYTKIPEYELFYSYSPTKQMFVDIYSRTLDINENNTSIIYLEPEAEIILSDTVNKTSYRLLYVNDGTYFDDVIWINDTSFIVLGHSIDYNSDEIFPEIIIFDIKKQQQINYKGISNKLNFDYILKRFYYCS